MKKTFFSFLLVAFFLIEGRAVFAQSVSALQAEQAATKNYLSSPTVTNRNILLSAINTVNEQASAPGNTTSPNAQSIELAALNAYNNTQAPATTVNSVNQSTANQIMQSGAETASVVARGGSCAATSASGAELPCASGLECDNDGICSPTPSSGSVSAGGWCGSNDSACLSGLSCNSSGICVTASAATSAGTSGSSNAGSNFVPLTNIPAITGFAGAGNLTAFFNNLYKICIGVAATIAVIQIMRAGIMYMGGDSITETKQARALIGTSVGGLLLVLSPVIVFGIINPKILSLQVGFTRLTPSQSANTGAGTTGTSATAPTPITGDGTVPPGGACSIDNNCGGDTSTVSYGCYIPSGSVTGTCTVDGDPPTSSATSVPFPSP
jgi:hypothetical protein